jgi:hypothetical protein
MVGQERRAEVPVAARLAQRPPGGEQPRPGHQAGVDRPAQATVGAGDLAGGGVPRQQAQLGVAEQVRGRHRRRHRLGVADRQDPHVGVQVDQAGQDGEPGHLQRLGTARPLAADRDDALTLHHHPRAGGRVTAAAVDQGATLQRQCHRVLLASRLSCRDIASLPTIPAKQGGDALLGPIRGEARARRWDVPGWCGRLPMGQAPTHRRPGRARVGCHRAAPHGTDSDAAPPTIHRGAAAVQPTAAARPGRRSSWPFAAELASTALHTEQRIHAGRFA